MNTSTYDPNFRFYTPAIIEKESIPKSEFCTDDVLCDEWSRDKRKKLLYFATLLGNLNKKKLLITFSDTEGLKSVYTTIWDTTDTSVKLKNDISLPIESIWDVDFMVKAS